jgi:ribosomal protein S18 acetylase RimI-like enzyme
VAEEDSKVIGYAVLYLSFSAEFGGVYTEIGELYIVPEFRGRSFGKQFIAYLEKESKSLGAKSVFLVASNSNFKAQKLYQNSGYQVLPRKEYIKSI